MLPIQNAPAPPISAPRSRAATGGAPGFALAPEPAANPAASHPASLPPATGAAEVLCGGLLDLQEAADGTLSADRRRRDRQARQHGRDILAALARLQHATLSGQVSQTDLQDLLELVTQPSTAADPGLQQLLSQILLRARVELARYN